MNLVNLIFGKNFPAFNARNDEPSDLLEKYKRSDALEKNWAKNAKKPTHDPLEQQ